MLSFCEVILASHLILYIFNGISGSTAVLSFNVIVVSVVLWYWTHTQKLQAMSLNDRSEGRQSKRSSPIKVIDIKYYKHILIIIYSFLFLGKNLEDFLKEKHISTIDGCCHQKLCHTSLDWQHLWQIHPLYTEVVISIRQSRKNRLCFYPCKIPLDGSNRYWYIIHWIGL